MINRNARREKIMRENIPITRRDALESIVFVILSISISFVSL